MDTGAGDPMALDPYQIVKRLMPKRQLSLERAYNLVKYGSEKPPEVSEGRWNAIVAHIRREYNDKCEVSDPDS